MTHDAQRIAAALTAQPQEPQDTSFQARVAKWMLECFGPEIPMDKTERNHRFIEEALELVQSLGTTASECHQLVDYTFGRPAGEPQQEVGGSIVTLAALCQAIGIDMAEAGETELARIWTKIETIRAKQAAKPMNSPLPSAEPRVNEAMVEAEAAKAEGWYLGADLVLALNALDAARAEIDRLQRGQDNICFSLETANAQLTAVRAERDEAQKKFAGLREDYSDLNEAANALLELKQNRIAELEAQIASEPTKNEMLSRTNTVLGRMGFGR